MSVRLYNVRVFKHEKLKLLHISINLEDSTSASLKSRYYKSKYAAKKGNDLNVNTGSFTDTFNFMLMNTDLEDWTEEIADINVSGQQAKRIKEEILSSYQDWTYSRKVVIPMTPSENKTSVNAKDMLTINPKNTNVKKFRSICKKVITGMTNVSGDDFNGIFNKLYVRLIKGSSITRYDVWNEFNSVKQKVLL